MTRGGRIDHIGHLSRRFFTSLSSSPPSVEDERWVAEHLLPGERLLWERMENADRRHSVSLAFVHRMW